MPVIFQGKTLERCPKGYTRCSKLAEIMGRPDSTCRTIEDCKAQIERATKENREKKGQGTTEGQLPGGEEDDEEMEGHKEKVATLDDYMGLIERGVIVDIETGRPIKMLDMGNLDEAVDFFKSLGRLFSNEVIKDTKLGEELNQFLNILNSEKLEGRKEVAAGITEKFLKNSLGLS